MHIHIYVSIIIRNRHYLLWGRSLELSIYLADTKDEREVKMIVVESWDILIECGVTKPLATLTIYDIPLLLNVPFFTAQF